MTKSKITIYKTVYSAVCLALAMVLPIITGTVPKIGNMLCPMHIPVLLCGFLCGWQWGVAVGFIAPLMRSFIFSMPPLYPQAASMAFELATYGLISGLLYKLLPKKFYNVYLTLIISMLSGRIVWGIARTIMAEISAAPFSFNAFISGAVVTAVPGIAVQIVFIPLIIALLKKAKLVLN